MQTEMQDRCRLARTGAPAWPLHTAAQQQSKAVSRLIAEDRDGFQPFELQQLVLCRALIYFMHSSERMLRITDRPKSHTSWGEILV